MNMRKFLLLIIYVAIVGIIGCEKPLLGYAELQEYYEESMHLGEATRDSVMSFSGKVQYFVDLHPDAVEEPVYLEIRKNIRLVLGLTDSSWGDDITITFGGNYQEGNGNDSDHVVTGNIEIDTTWAGVTDITF